MYVSIDNLAHRYGMLPSEALIRGSSLDFKIMAIASAYQNHINKKGNLTADNKPVVPTLSKEELIEMMKKAKEIQNAEN